MNHFLMVLVECLNSRHFRINKLHSHLECFYILSGYLPAIHAAIAQWIERRIAVPKVRGSTPLGDAMKILPKVGGVFYKYRLLWNFLLKNIYIYANL